MVRSGFQIHLKGSTRFLMTSILVCQDYRFYPVLDRFTFDSTLCLLLFFFKITYVLGIDKEAKKMQAELIQDCFMYLNFDHTISFVGNSHPKFLSEKA